MFHVLQSFRREVTVEKMEITSEEKSNCLEILSKCVYSWTEEEYIENYKLLQSTNLKKVIDYFDKNWHSNRQEWVAGMKSNNLTLMNLTNNRIERLNLDIKAVCSKNASLADFF